MNYVVGVIAQYIKEENMDSDGGESLGGEVTAETSDSDFSSDFSESDMESAYNEVTVDSENSEAYDGEVAFGFDSNNSDVTVDVTEDSMRDPTLTEEQLGIIVEIEQEIDNGNETMDEFEDAMRDPTLTQEQADINDEIELQENESIDKADTSVGAIRDFTLSQEQAAIVQEMEQKGEMDVYPDQLGETKVGGTNERLGEIHIGMPYNPAAKYEIDTFKGQVQDQEDGLNNLSVKDYLDNYSDRFEFGRSSEGTKMQNQYNDGLKESLIYDKMQEGKSFEQAEKESSAEMFNKAALHSPDQAAGGNPMVIAAKGDASVNSALGSLWGHGRAAELYDRVNEMSKNMSDEEKANTYLNVRLDTYEK